MSGFVAAAEEAIPSPTAPLSETCDDDLPHLITNVETTAATTTDDAVTPRVHAALAQRDLLPSVHLVDTGFIDTEMLVESDTQYALDLLGPVRGVSNRQARAAQGFAAPQFHIDWDRRHAICPTGCISQGWTPGTIGDARERGHHVRETGLPALCPSGALYQSEMPVAQCPPPSAV